MHIHTISLALVFRAMPPVRRSLASYVGFRCAAGGHTRLLVRDTRCGSMRITILDGRQLVGRFLAFDRHMNLVLGDAEEFRRLPPKKGVPDADRDVRRPLGLVLVRGEEVISLTVEGPPPTDDRRGKRDVAPVRLACASCSLGFLLPHASTPLLPLRRGQAAAKLQGEAFRRRCRARCPRGWRGPHEASAGRAPLPCAPRRDCIPPFSPSTHPLAHTDFRAAADDAARHAPAGASVSYAACVCTPSIVLTHAPLRLGCLACLPWACRRDIRYERSVIPFAGFLTCVSAALQGMPPPGFPPAGFPGSACPPLQPGC